MPSGEFVWFIPVIIGAAIGAYSGWQIGKAQGATGWGMFGYIAGGAMVMYQIWRFQCNQL